MKKYQRFIGCHSVAAASISTAFLLAIASQSQAGAIINFTFTSDATSQISSGKTYLTKADPGDATAATVNGVAFDAGTLSSSTLYTSTNLTLALTSGTGNLALSAGNSNDLPTGASATLLTDLVTRSGDSGTANGVLTLTFSGLTPGTQYSARIYYRQFSNADPRNNTFFFDEDGAGALGSSSGTVSEDAGPDNDHVANVIGYNFTAQGALPLVVTVTQAANNNAWHFYAVTNEVVPEPSSLALLGLSTSGFMIWRRRRRA